MAGLFALPRAMLKTPMDLWLQVRELPLVETLEKVGQRLGRFLDRRSD